MRTTQNQFLMVFARNEEKLDKKQPDFLFKLQSVYFLTIRGQRHLSTVLVL